MKKTLVAAIAIVAGGAFWSQSAQASTINVTLANGQNSYSDQSYEDLINVNGGATTVDVGDKLRGILRIDQVDNTSGSYIFGSGWNEELTAIFEVEVKSKTALGGNMYTWSFGPSSTFETTYGAGAMVAFFTDPANDFNGLNTTVAAAEASATNGTAYFTLGFTGAGGAATGGEGWAAFSMNGDDVSLAQTLTKDQTFGNFNYSVNILSSVAAPSIARVQSSVFGPGLVDITGSGNLKGIKGLNTPFDLTDNIDLGFQTAVPEPATMSLFGLGLAGLAKVSRRKKANSNKTQIG